MPWKQRGERANGMYLWGNTRLHQANAYRLGLASHPGHDLLWQASLAWLEHGLPEAERRDIWPDTRWGEGMDQAREKLRLRWQECFLAGVLGLPQDALAFLLRRE
jgi:hypothetical protein